MPIQLTVANTSKSSTNVSDRPKWFTAKQIALIYSLNYKSVLYYLRKYKVPRMRLGGGIKVRQDIWEEFAKTREVDSTYG